MISDFTMLKNAPLIKWPAENSSGHVSRAGHPLLCPEGAPREVSGDFDVSRCGLLSLKGLPSRIGKDLICSSNRLRSFDGGPVEIEGDLYLQGNNLKSLFNLYKHVTRVNRIYAKGNPIESHLLSVFLIPGCRHIEIDNIQAMSIVNKFLRSAGGDRKMARRQLLHCQLVLIEHNFEEFAQI